MAYDAFASIFTVSGSSVSCLATLATLLYCLAARERHLSLRHALVVNLCVANFLNTFNNTISGFIYVDVHQLYPGHACRANGFFALMTAQAVDFTILAIVLVTFLAVLRLLHLPKFSSWRPKILICSSIWAIPCVTSLTALTMDALRPVDMNWCDITTRMPRLRYALAGGWRLAIMLLAVCLYALICCFAYRHSRVLSAATGVRASGQLHTSNKTVDPARTASTSSNFSILPSSVQSASRPDRFVDGAGAVCSELSLPLQGYDVSGTEFQKGKALDSKTERISRWIHVRRPVMINSISAFKSQSQSRLLIPQTSPDSPFTRPFNVTVEPKAPGLLLSTLPRPCSSLTTGPNYHNQCPKVRKTFEISSNEEPGLAKLSPVYHERQSSGSRYKDSAKSVNSMGARTQSSFETVPWRIYSAGPPPAPEVKWPFFDISSSSAQSSNRASTSTSSGEYLDAGPLQCSHGSKAAASLTVGVNHNHQTLNSPSAVHPPGSQDSDQRYRDKGAPMQEALSHLRLQEKKGHSGPTHHNEVPVEHLLERSVGRVRNDAVATPAYHNQCPKVKQTFEVSVSSPEETVSGLNHYNQRPQRNRPVRIPPLGPKLPNSHSLILRPDMCSTKTTIVTAPKEPPPSPTPGLPPPPWSPEAKEQRRKTFLLSRSTWSDSMISQSSPGAGDAVSNEMEIRRTLLLNAYPLAYFILSLPWMVNCFIEVQGHTPQDNRRAMRAMHALLGLPQYLGLVNAIIFGVNESLKTLRRVGSTTEPGRTKSQKGSLDSEGV